MCLLPKYHRSLPTTPVLHGPDETALQAGSRLWAKGCQPMPYSIKGKAILWETQVQGASGRRENWTWAGWVLQSQSYWVKREPPPPCWFCKSNQTKHLFKWNHTVYLTQMYKLFQDNQNYIFQPAQCKARSKHGMFPRGASGAPVGSANSKDNSHTAIFPQ